VKWHVRYSFGHGEIDQLSIIYQASPAKGWAQISSFRCRCRHRNRCRLSFSSFFLFFFSIIPNSFVPPVPPCLRVMPSYRARRTGSLCILRLASTRASCPSSLSVFAAKNTPLREILALFCPQTHFKKITVETNVRIISLSLSRVCLECHFCPQKHPSKSKFSPFFSLKRSLSLDLCWSDPDFYVSHQT
jgi:hypothetical protein